MNTCGTCKHFGPVVDELTLYPDGEAVSSTYHKCMLLKHLNERRPHDEGLPAGVIDGSGYFAALCVHEEFGCNQWQPVKAGESRG